MEQQTLLETIRNILELPISDIVAVVVGFAGILAVSFRSFSFFKKQVQSEREIQLDIESSTLAALRVEIGKEKDEEAKTALRRQAEELRRKYNFDLFDNLRTSEGVISDDWREPLLLARRRLVNETDRLMTRSSSNLAIGITIAIMGIIVLVLIVFVFPPSVQINNTATFLAQYVPRISIILIVEILAAFFLRMYSKNERDIYRNKNEITNLELRLSAGLMRLHHGSVLADISLSLATEERNFLLGKNESSTPIDKNKLVDTAAKLVSKAVPNEKNGDNK